MNKETIEILKRWVHLRHEVVKALGTEFGGYEYKGRGRGMGRFLLGLTAYGRTVNGKTIISNGVF